jgi:transposase
MIKPEIQSAVRTLYLQKQHSLREITRALKLSRNTVRRILRTLESAGEGPRHTAGPPPGGRRRRRLPQPLDEHFTRAKGNVVRLQQLLQSERGQAVPYSTLTRWVREAQLREAPQRSGEYTFQPSEEMQHDTSPHKVAIGEKTLTAQCAALILAYSRRLYVQYYPRFGRLETKHFLLEAARFMDGTCARCVIDNSSVILAGGAGEDAIIAPEMHAFARTLGFTFMAHRVGDPDRKGRIERAFFWIETNFLPGRTFRDFADLNAQALTWCREIANAKPKRALGMMSPEAAYVLEKPYLKPLPAVLPPVYEVIERVADLSGFVSMDSNRYSVPDRLIGQAVSVYKYPGELQIFHRGQLIATHPRILDRRDAKQILPQHHPRLVRAARRERPEEPLLRAAHPLLDRYVTELTRRDRHGATRLVQPRRALKRLLEIKRTYPHEPFLAALEQALRFGLFDLGRLEALVLKYVSGEFFALDSAEEAGDDPQNTGA